VNRRKPRVQTPVVSRYPAPALIDDFVFLFLPPCGPHSTPLATESLESGLLVSLLLWGPTRYRLFAPTLHLHQCKSSRNLHLQYLAKSQSTPRCQSLMTARSDHPPVLGCSDPQLYICTRPRHGLVQMCPHLYLLVALTGINVKPTHLYRVEPPTVRGGICTGWWLHPVQMLLFVLGENTGYKSKIRPRTNTWFSSSDCSFDW
jgi:hypothetical protein